MQALTLILFLLAAVVASSILDKVLRPLSLPLVQIALGALIALFATTPVESGIDPELLLILFIAPLHFNESRHADSGELWKNRWGIASLAVGLVFAIAFSTGGALHVLVPALPLSLCIAFGAAMGSTDAVAVTELSKDYRFGRRHEALLTGEAFFNDVTGTVVFQCCISLAATGAFSLMHAGEEFALDLFGGMVGGAIMGVVAWGIFEGIRRLGVDSPTLHVTLELLLPFGIYLIAAHIHIGAVIAVVTAGLMMSLLPHRHTAATAQQKLQSRSVWDTLSFILNGVIFVILGMQLPRILHPTEAGGLGDPMLIGVVIVLTVILEGVRFFWIWGMDAVCAKRAGGKARDVCTRKALKNTLAMAFAGPKGAITLSLMLTVPATFAFASGGPMRNALLSVAAGVILCTLILADFAVPALVPHKREAKRSKERVDAEVELVERVIASIQADAHLTGDVRASGALEGDGVDEPATAIVMKRYVDQLRDLASHASEGVRAQALSVADVCHAVYEGIEDVAEQLREAEDDETQGEAKGGSAGSPSLTAHLDQLRRIYDAVEDVQAQALSRELEIIRDMHRAGRIDAERATELRNDVYIQQITL